MHIRRARSEEAVALTTLARRSKAHWGYDAAFLAACSAELNVSPDAIARGEIYVVEDERSVLGLYALEPIDAECMELSMLFVEPRVIGHGHGRHLLDHAKMRARAMGAKKLSVEADPNAVGFYVAAGARKVGMRPSALFAGRFLPQFELTLQ